MLVAPLARAQDTKQAEMLFQLGKGAMGRQEYTKACEYFQGSLNADFALGTLLNLATCHEQAGKLASAWSEFHELEDKARRATPPQPEREKFAREHAEKLQPRLSRLRINLAAEDTTMTGFVVKIDGVVAQPELFGTGIPVDTGKRSVSAWAPDHEAWTQTVSVDDEKLKLEVAIPPLKAQPKAPPPPPPKADPAVLEAVKQREAAKSRRTIGFVVGGIGIAALGAGTVFGIMALGAKSDSTVCNNGCYRGSTDLSNAHDAYTRANTFGWVSNIALGAGIIGAGIGAYLVLTGGSDDDAANVRAGITPGGLVIGGAM